LFVDPSPSGGRTFADLDCSTTPPPAPAVDQTYGCFLSQADFNFMNAGTPVSTATAEHEHWLPSFNVKFELTDEWLARFAASKAIARPDIGNMRNYVGVSANFPSRNDVNDPLWIKDSGGNITGMNVRYTGSAQNPFLAPVEAVQYDLTLEYYFADVGSFTMALFDKQFDDYIQFGRYFREVNNNGTTREVEVSGPLNGEGAGLKGYEVAFQSFFEFLPAPFDGLGVQLNFTHIDNEGVTNSNVSAVGGEGTTVTDQAPDSITVNRLEGLSDDSYTLILMYEDETFSSRLAYSWRSEYMVTAIDCCVAYPIWTEDYGQVDGSFTWHFDDNFEFHVQGKNLTNAETKNLQQVSNFEDGGLLLPTGWFQNDRTYTIGFRYRM
jgi:TonB-dependent receptor